jgi:hypothetical protein
MRQLRDSERGAVLVLVAGSMVLLLAIAALVLDLAALRADRARSRTVSDQAATSGSLELWAGDGTAACETALAYINLNMHGGPFTGADCTSLPSSCGPGTAAVSTQATSGQWTATITYPVPDGHPLLDPAAIGATTQAIHTEDGVRCERLGVQIEGTRQFFFANVLGAVSGDTEVHAVARAKPSDSADMVLNLLILERYDCDAISAAGGAGVGGIVTDAIWNPEVGAFDPGWIAVDSDGSSGVDCSANGVLDVDGINAFIRADGPAGCPGELIPGTGDGCGEIRVLADGQPYPGCNQPACTSSGVVAPLPERLPRRVTRSPVDYRYNCRPGGYSFDPGYDISPCTKQPPTPPYIDQLVAAYGGAGTVPAGFESWTSLSHPCTVAPGTTININNKNVYIDCLPRLGINGSVKITGGDVIAEGDVVIQSGATLEFNKPALGVPHVPHIFYMRDGQLGKAGSANLYLYKSTVYMSEASQLDLGGGTGELVWQAPNDPAYRFDDLALWSEGTSEHKFAGQAVLDLSGVFFVPRGTVAYAGQGNQLQISAQFISRKLKSSGQGLLIVAPEFDHAVLFPELLDIQLIR